MSAFDTAVADSKKLTSKPSNEELLDLYGMPRPAPRCDAASQARDVDEAEAGLTSHPAALYKIAQGEDISSAPAPGMFDLKVRCSLLPLATPSRSRPWSFTTRPLPMLSQMLC